MTLRSLYLDVLSQIVGHVKIFAFDDRRLTFLKSSPRDWLELQSFLFCLQRFFGWRFFFLLRCHFLRWRNYVRLGFVWNGWGRCCAFGRHRLFKRTPFLARPSFHRPWRRFHYIRRLRWHASILD